MRASVERRKAQEAQKQARRDEILGTIGAAISGLVIGGIFGLYSILH